MLRALFLFAVGLGGFPGEASGQDLAYFVALGFGHTSWTGPHIEGGKWDIPLAAVASEWRPASAFGVRAELAAGPRRADLVSTGLFSEETTLGFYKLQLGLLGRYYLSRPDRRIQFFGEVGVSGWVRIGCDVDMVGGPIFGGETVDCDRWEPESQVGLGPLDPKGSGVSIQLGAGARRGAWGMSLRYDMGGTHVESGTGPMKAKAVFLAFEWVFHQSPKIQIQP